jgi:ADP-ribose pyrophosphatase
MSESPQQLEGRLLFHGSRFDVVAAPQQTADGRTVEKQVVRHPGAVVIVPLLVGDRLCLIRNVRIAAGKTLIELPAGTLDPPEPPAKAAVRELKEETGYTAASWRELPSFYTSPGICTEKMFVFVAQGLTEGDHAREEGENIENYVVPWGEAIAMAERGDIEDGKTICALLMWDRLRNREA